MQRINDVYDVGAAFSAVEDKLISSMIRNMKRHKVEEVKEDKQWTMWQAEQLKALEKYRKANQKKFGKQFRNINDQIDALIRAANDEGMMDQEITILKAIKKGFSAKRAVSGATAEFFKLNDRKLEALIKATMNDMKKAEVAVLRMADDQYRRIIFNAQVYANTGAGTYEKAVDMATKDFLTAGLNCVQYANGARHTISDYADMAIRTACKRAYLQGEGVKRQEWGVSTVIMNKRGNPCPLCLPFIGKVLIDDVWSGGSRKDGSYPLLSKAIAAGLYHPRCKDSHTTYFHGISTANDTWTKEELAAIGQANRTEAKKQYAERQEKRFERLEKNSLDEENQKRYAARREEWKMQKELMEKPIAKTGASGIMKLPKYENVVIPKAKFTQYALNPEKDPDKAKAFKKALGYTMDNADELISQIYDKISEYDAREKPDNGWGKRYEVIMDITGINGKTAKVLTAWIDDKNTGEMRLTSVYVDKE